MTPFQDRHQAGRVLANRLLSYAHDEAVCVLGLPRGGVPVAYEVAMALHAPLDVFVVRKLGVPKHEELAMGAIARGPGTALGSVVRVLNPETVQAWGVSEAEVEAVLQKEQAELSRRELQYRSHTQPVSLKGRKVLLVDDGLATGSTMRVAIMAAREHEPACVVVGVPISEPGTCSELAAMADDVVCAITPQTFHSVGEWYVDFAQTSDAEVQYLLARAAHERSQKQYVPVAPMES